MGMGMGNPFDLPQVPSVSELWKNEKSKYRHWVILFAVALVVLLALSVVAIVLNVKGMEDWVAKPKYYLDENSNKVEFTADEKRRAFIVQYIVPGAIRAVFFVLAIIFFAITITKVYKQKNFAHLSQWATLAVAISAIMSIWELFSIAFSKDSIQGYATETSGGLYSLIFSIAVIVIWLLVSMPMVRIRKIFALSQFVEDRRKDPVWQQQKAQYEAMMRAAGQINPGAFGASAFGPQVTPAQPAPAENGETVTPATPEVEPERKRLEGLSEAKLKKVAKELSISGSENMKKDELIEAILRVTKGDK